MIRAKLISRISKLSIQNFVMLTIAGIINALGVTAFLVPVHLYDSGASGTAMLLAQIAPKDLGLSLFLLLLNVPLFLYGLKMQGKAFTVYAIYAVIIYSIAVWIISDRFSSFEETNSPLAGKDLLLCALFGGIISGIGSGTAIRFGGAMDGVEVMAVIFAKRIGITVGTFVMIYNVILYTVCGIFLQSWILPLYSTVAYMAALKTVDFIVEGIDRAKCAMIVTTKPEEVCSILSMTFESGMTRINALGAYSHQPKTLVYFVLNRFQVPKAKELIYNVDKSAYITITEVADIFKAD